MLLLLVLLGKTMMIFLAVNSDGFLTLLEYSLYVGGVIGKVQVQTLGGMALNAVISTRPLVFPYFLRNQNISVNVCEGILEDFRRLFKIKIAGEGRTTELVARLKNTELATAINIIGVDQILTRQVSNEGLLWHRI